MKRGFIIIILALLVFSDVKGQSVNWAAGAGFVQDHLLVPSTTLLSLPTTNAYKVGAFSIDGLGTTLICMGSAMYTPGVDTDFRLFYDATGEVGYVMNERIVTLMQDQVTMNTYAVEFIYENDNAYFKNNSAVIHKVLGIKCSTWDYVFTTNNVCKNTTPTMSTCLPFGIHSTLSFSSGVLFTPTNDIDISAMNPGTYTISVIANSTDIKFRYYTQTFSVTNYPYSVATTIYPLCQGVSTLVPSTNVSLSLVYTPVGSYGYTLTDPGSYLYKATYTVNGCYSYDTIKITRNLNCEESNLLLNPNAANAEDGMIYFSKSETIKIYNKANKEVHSINAPANWDGHDKYGVILPVGVYFIVHEDGSKQSVTIVH